MRAPITDIPTVGTAVRAGGNLDAKVSRADGEFRAGVCEIDTPLPEGYPEPTPPGAIDIKTYPSVRRAEVRGRGTPDVGMNSAFWPLFNHIKSHDIAMTTPVEIDYRDMNSRDSSSRDWSMAFLYRTTDMNQPGEEGEVVVRDAQPVTVVAIGLKGNYSMSLVRRGMETIEAWLADNPQWQPAGSWRSLYYNGPSLLWWNKWAEVQLPVKPAGA